MKRSLAAVLAAMACACGSSDTSPVALGQKLRPAETALTGGSASVSLSNSGGALVQTSNTSWTLSKTGSVNTTTKTVNWTITATKGAVGGGHLTVDGFMKVSNSGTGPATIRNVVVNLQTWNTATSTWVTQSSDIADSTNGDAATFANVSAKASSEHKTNFTENAASGHLSFTDQKTNTLFSISPAITLAPGASISLLFTAGFNNNVLALATGKNTRTEVIVSFGNGQSWDDSDIDINDNGVIDADEHHVRSVAARFQATVPANIAANSAPILTDTAANVVATGTVTLGTPSFTLGATGGTSTVTYTGGTGGGNITNCAHLTGAGSSTTVGGFVFHNEDGFSEQACNSVTVGPTTCTPGTVGCGWQDGDMVTYNQGEWGDTPNGTNAASLLENNYLSVYAPFGTFEVGLGTGGFSMIFTGSAELLAYLPAGGAPGALDANLLDPTSSSSGAFGGEVSALKLNIDYSDAGLLGGTAGLPFGSLTVCNLSATRGLNGSSIRLVLSLLNSALGGAPSTYAIADLEALALQINGAFFQGSASAFAQAHLFNGACPVCTPGAAGCPWNVGDMLTYSQSDWGTGGAGSSLLNADFNTVYASTFDSVVVGLTSGGFAMSFSGPNAVQAYVPVGGPAAALTSNLGDPTSSSSGVFGGLVLALQLNVDFSDAGFLHGSSPSKLGDLTLCSFSTLPALNGTTVRQFLGMANTSLGGGSTTYALTDIAQTTGDIDLAFGGGLPNTFAQTHLFKGPCP